MDSPPDFIEELERAMTGTGSDKVWKRTVGGVEIWFSPITVPAQEKVQLTLQRTDLGPNLVLESKRTTLAHAIVGINGVDLTPYRAGAAVFPITNKEGKRIKVRLEEYIHWKMATWGGQFVDDVFSVFSDLIDTHQTENLKEVKFENAKDPRVELLELEARAAELRDQLGMPSMVEAGSSAAGAPVDRVESIEPNRAPDDETEALAKDSVDPDFDPFKPVRRDPVPQHVADAEANMEAIRRSRSHGRTVPTAPAPAPAQRDPVPEDEIFPDVPTALAEPPSVIMAPVSPGEVLDRQADRVHVPPPPIDRLPVNANPRFARPRR